MVAVNAAAAMSEAVRVNLNVAPPGVSPHLNSAHPQLLSTGTKINTRDSRLLPQAEAGRPQPLQRALPAQQRDRIEQRNPLRPAHLRHIQH